MQRIGITERGDAALNLSWKAWVREGKPAILITKDPGKLAEHLLPTDNVIVHCTITGYGGTKLEPNVPKADDAILSIGKVYEKLHKSPRRIVLRVDPIIPNLRGYSVARNIILAADDTFPDRWSHRVRISFLDNYSHVKERFRKAGVDTAADYNFHAPLLDRKIILHLLKEDRKYLQIEVCGEPDMECTGCISELDCNVLGVEQALSTSQQRKACACLSQKVELLKKKGQCKHKCLYCYWK